MKNIIKVLVSIMIIIVTIITLTGCEDEVSTKGKKKKKTENITNTIIQNTENTENMESSKKNPLVTMDVVYYNENGQQKEGIIEMELYPNSAPITVANFVNLVQNGFYNGLTFHRIVKDFVIQGGDPKGDGTGNPYLSDLDKTIKKNSSEDYEYSIKGEFILNHVKNDIEFEAGTVAMARADYSFYGFEEEGFNSGASQFFIMVTDDESTNQHLQGDYAAFGKVVKGYDVALEIANTKVVSSATENDSKPEHAPVIKSMKVDTKGESYKVPETLNAGEVKKKIEEYREYIQRYLEENNLN